jgi:hypothetical protein
MKQTILLLCLLISTKVFAQRSVTTGTVETDGGLGYTFPVVDLTQSVEFPMKGFELDPAVTYSVAHKIGINNGYELSGNLAGDIWLTNSFGLADNVSYTRLKNSNYQKNSFLIEPGVAFRNERLQSKFTFYGLIPNGTIQNGIESNRVSGLQFNWQMLMGSAGPFTIRANLLTGYYHGYSQGNPECDGTYGGPITCPRESWNTGNVEVGISFVFPKQKSW